jgi:hypothetical protein
MITPGWIALVQVANPARMILIVAVTMAAYLIVQAVQRVVILYGKRLFASVVMVAVFLQVTLFIFLIRPLPNVYGYSTLGFVVPGLIAYQMIRQPILPTAVALATVTLVSYSVLVGGALLRFLPFPAARSVPAGARTIELTPLRVSLLLGAGVLVLAVVAWSLRRVRAGYLEPGGADQGGPFDPLAYVTASERRPPAEPPGPADGDGHAGGREPDGNPG